MARLRPRSQLDREWGKPALVLAVVVALLLPLLLLCIGLAQLAVRKRVPSIVDEVPSGIRSWIAYPGGIRRQAMKPFGLVTCDGSAAEGLIACGSAISAESSYAENAASIYDWDWDVDHLVLYRDPLHSGWYLAFNTRLGTCFRIMFL